jgi:hypothetical protein
VSDEELPDGEELVRAAAALLNELRELRQFPVPPHEADGFAVHAAVRELRTRLDRAEVIMALMAGYKRRQRGRAAEAKAAADDVFDEEMARLAKLAVRMDYQGVRDREALAGAKALSERKKVRAAAKLAERVDQADDAARGMFFGLRDIRRELLATLEHYLPWESSMER